MNSEPLTARDPDPVRRNIEHAAPSIDALLAPDVVDQLTRNRGVMATGFDPLDGVLEGGVQPEELAIVAGQPGIGKTIFLLQSARHLAKQGHRLAVATYEHRELAVICQFLAIEVGEMNGHLGPTEHADVLGTIADVAAGRTRWDAAMEANATFVAAATELSTYALHIGLVSQPTLTEGFGGLVDSLETDTDVLIVDHLQKVPVDRDESIGAKLKALAVDRQIAVLAASPIGDSGLSTRRLRLAHLRDAAAVTHEADIVITLNDKISAVSRNHSGFDSRRARDFRRYTVLTVEKNRRGMGGVDMEFVRDFSHRRFDPAGSFVTDTLVDGFLVVD